MKVLHIISSLTAGGAEKLIIDSLPIYKQEHIDVDLVVLKDLGKSSIFQNNLTKKFFGKVNYLSKGTVYNPFLIFKIIRYIKQYDLVHIHLFPAIYWTVLAKLLLFKNVKLIFTEHNTLNKRRDIKFLKPVEKFIYDKLDFIGCISEATKTNLIDHLSFKKNNIQVIENGILLDNFQNLNNVDYNFFDVDSFIITQVSSFREQKDQPTILRALKKLPSNFKLLLIGNGHLLENNIALAKELGVYDRVKFLGIRNDIPTLLNYSDVVVLSSNYEGFGLAIVEGMAANKPCIASNIDGIKQVVENYGLLFEVGNQDQLASHLLELYTNKDYYNIISKKCFARSVDFDIKNMVRKYINVYTELVK